MRWIHLLVNGLLTAFVVTISIVETGCGGVISPASPQEIHQALQDSLTATGTANPDSRTQYFGTSYQYSLAWELEITLENQSKFPITFGNVLILFEADAAGGTYDGVLVTYDLEGELPSLGNTYSDNLAPTQKASYYSLSNAEVRYADGGSSFQRGNTVGINFKESSFGEEVEVAGFGGLDSGEIRTFEEDLEVGAWVSEEHRASVRIVLPELMVKRGNEEPARFSWVLYFQQPNNENEEWVFNRQEVILLEPDGLEQQFLVPETNQVTRVLAANWLANIAPDRAQSALLKVGQGLREGDLLAVCISHLTHLRAEGFGDHAQSLLSDTDSPNGIRRLSAKYLGTMRYEPALSVLIETVGDEEDSVALGAIDGLGNFGGPEGSAALLNLAKGKAGREYSETIFRNLALTRQNDALNYLEEQARRKNDEALSALILEGAPESFDFFVEFAGSKRNTVDRDQLARGLTRSGGERAADLLMQWLEQEELGNENYPLTTSTVVDELTELNLPALIPRLQELTTQGHLPALQVLSGYEDPSARGPLESLAREVDGKARLIALDGLSRRWPEGNEEVFEQALREEPTDDLVPVAVRGLIKTRQDALPPLLLPLMHNDDEMVRSEAASALAHCDPDIHGDGYIQALLGTTDDQIAVDLVNGLIDHGWKETNAIGNLTRKLEESEEDGMRFQIIRLLRHLSAETMGPEDYEEFWDDPDKWTKRWLEWAKENGSS